MRLHESARHFKGTHADWQPARVEAWLRRYAAEALAVRARGPWPLHPLDAEGESPDRAFHCLYLGAAGMWLALDRLARAGWCELPRGLDECMVEAWTDYVKAPDTGERVPSWFLGESAPLTISCVLRPEAERLERLAEVIRSNHDNPTREALWGAPGTMLAALFMHEATGEARWADLFREGAAALWRAWELDEASGAWTWQQDLYGQQVRYVGAGHGWAGNLQPLWRGQALLDGEQRALLRTRTLAGLERLALRDGELANWPPVFDKPEKLLVQWCHGAPGVITSLRGMDGDEALPWLLRGGRLIVAAGPLIKGAGLCHGTAGNGAALLELHRRTGDAEWLARARAFAMAAIDQSEAHVAEHGQWRHSLWTGDAGVAWFLLDCLEGASRGLPGLDVLA